MLVAIFRCFPHRIIIEKEHLYECFQKDYIPDFLQNFRAATVSSIEIFLLNIAQSEHWNYYHKRKEPEGEQDYYQGNPPGTSFMH